MPGARRIRTNRRRRASIQGSGLSEIAAIGSISILFIHTVTHIGHLKIISKTGTSRILIFIVAIRSFSALVLAIIYISKASGHVLYILSRFILVVLITDVLLRKIVKREIKTRAT